VVVVPHIGKIQVVIVNGVFTIVIGSILFLIPAISAALTCSHVAIGRECQVRKSPVFCLLLTYVILQMVVMVHLMGVVGGDLRHVAYTAIQHALFNVIVL
jgi:hypothetical protein